MTSGFGGTQVLSQGVSWSQAVAWDHHRRGRDGAGGLAMRDPRDANRNREKKKEKKAPPAGADGAAGDASAARTPAPRRVTDKVPGLSIKSQIKLVKQFKAASQAQAGGSAQTKRWAPIPPHPTSPPHPLPAPLPFLPCGPTRDLERRPPLLTTHLTTRPTTHPAIHYPRHDPQGTGGRRRRRRRTWRCGRMARWARSPTARSGTVARPRPGLSWSTDTTSSARAASTSG